MKKCEEILRACPLFEGISSQNLSAMVSCLGARTVSAARGEMIFREGEPARYVGLMLSGSGQIIREDYFGNRTILARIEEGICSESLLRVQAWRSFRSVWQQRKTAHICCSTAGG